LGEPSTGARDDLEKATEIAQSMVKKYGMSKLGLRSFGKENRSAFLEAAGVSSKDYSEKTAEEIDQEIRRILDAGAEKDRGLLGQHKPLLLLLSQRLLEKETLERDELERNVPPHLRKSLSPPQKKLILGRESVTLNSQKYQER